MDTKTTAKCGLFAALCVLCSWLAIPVGDISFTLQAFAVFLGLFFLGGQYGSIAFFVYLCLGAVGLPVFSGFRGGFGAFFQPTGGYLWGFLLGCGLFWLLEKRCRPILAAAAAMAVCYACGSAWYYFAYTGGGIANLWAVLLRCVAPYLPADALKIHLAYLLCRRLKQIR